MNNSTGNRGPFVLPSFKNHCDLYKYIHILGAIANNPRLPNYIDKQTNRIISSDFNDKIIKSLGSELISWRNLYLKGESDSDVTLSSEIVKLISRRNKVFLHFCKESSIALKCNILSEKAASSRIRHELKHTLESYVDLIDSNILYDRLTISHVEDGLLINENGENLKGKTLHRFTCSDKPENSEDKHNINVFLYVATIGPLLDNRVKELSEDGKEFYEAYLLNGLGAGLTDTIVQDFQFYLDEQHSVILKNRKLHRISPGYKDWLLSDQRVIFRILKPKKNIGVKLLSTFLMHPLKSTSGLMGIDHRKMQR